MRMSSIGLIIVGIINLIVSLYFNVSNNFLVMLLMDTLIWGVLFLPFYFISRKDKKFFDVLIRYCFYYMVSLVVLNILFVIFGVSFIIIKVINLFIVGILGFIDIESSWLKKVNVYLFLFNYVFFFLLSSSMVPIGSKNSNVDYSVFRYIGLLMHKGGVPYRDVFDHKGILLYFINYLGMGLDYEIGVWVLELVFLYLSSIVIYKITKLFSDKLNILSTIIMFLSMIFMYKGGGNNVELYGIFFILVGLYLFYKDIKLYGDVRLKSAFLIGITLGAILLLRPNMIGLYIVLCIYLLILYLKNKRYKDLFKLIGMFLLGIIIFVLPFIIYLGVNEALDDCIYQYIIFNFNYSKNNSNSEIIDTAIFYFKNCKLIYISFIICIFLMFTKKCDRKNLLLSLFMILVSFTLVVIPRNEYNHYTFVMIPCMIYPIIVFSDYIYNKIYKFIDLGFLVKFMLYVFIFFFFYTDIVDMFKSINDMLMEEDRCIDEVSDIVSLTEEDDSVLSFGNSVNVLLKSKRFTKSKYPYHLPVMAIDEGLKEEFLLELKDEMPKVILVYDGAYNIFIEWFIEFIPYYDFYKVGDNYVLYLLKNTY